jgi:hypothetical protein
MVNGQVLTNAAAALASASSSALIRNKPPLWTSIAAYPVLRRQGHVVGGW